MPIEFHSSAPQLPVRDIAEAIDFYVGKLGFEKRFGEGEIPVYAIVGRGSANVHLALDRTGNQAGHAGCCLFLTGIDEFYADVRKNGVQVHRELEDSKYGLRDFTFADLDGNVLLAGERVASHEP